MAENAPEELIEPGLRHRVGNVVEDDDVAEPANTSSPVNTTATTTTTEEDATGDEEPKSDESSEPATDDTFSCNICLESASEPVVTLCGHVYCWPCIYTWMEHSGNQTCPVCKAGCTKDKLIPIYGRGKEPKDPRANIPNRPRAQRPEPLPNAYGPFGMGGFQRTGNVGNMQFAFSAGLFPSLFGMHFNFPAQQPGPNAPEAQQQETITRALFVLGTLVLMFLLFV